MDDIAPGGVANSGPFLCERELLEHPQFANAADFSYDVFQVAMAEQIAPLYACDIGGGFRYDIGTVSRFFDANMRALRGQIACTLPGREAERGVWLGDDVVVGNGSSLAAPVVIGRGARLGTRCRVGPHAAIGDGCVLGDGATVRDAVLLPNSRLDAEASIDTCILGRNVRLGAGVSLPPYSILGAHDVAGGGRWPI